MPTTLSATQSVAFKTDLGWFALAFASRPKPVLSRLVFGHSAESSALRRLKADGPTEPVSPGAIPPEVEAWIDLLQGYAAGQPVSLKPIPVDQDHLTPFGKQVARACLAIPYGATRSYGQLALAAGRPAPPGRSAR